jgi:hypothetical protein
MSLGLCNNCRRGIPFYFEMIEPPFMQQQFLAVSSGNASAELVNILTFYRLSLNTYERTFDSNRAVTPQPFRRLEILNGPRPSWVSVALSFSVEP